MNAMVKKRILIIEDDPHIAEGIELNLSLQGYEVKVAQNGIEGLESWKQWCPHLIVLDLMLPGIDGMQILKNIRLEDERLPILILSAKVDAADRVDGFLVGVDDYMTKPFSLEEFLLRVNRLLTRDQWQREQDDSLKTPSEGTEPVPLWSQYHRFFQRPGRVLRRYHPIDRAGNQITQTLYRQQRKTPVSQQITGNRMGLQQGHIDPYCR